MPKSHVYLLVVNNVQLIFSFADWLIYWLVRICMLNNVTNKHGSTSGNKRWRKPKVQSRMDNPETMEV